MKDNWIKKHLAHARFEALQKSKDPSTKVACLIVDEENSPISTGYNGMPRGVNDNLTDRLQRPVKYKWMQHAESNSIANAARNGISTRNCTAIVTHFTCAYCAGQLINAGIKRVIIDGTQMSEDFLTRYAEDVQIATQMYTEAAVELIIYK